MTSWDAVLKKSLRRSATDSASASGLSDHYHDDHDGGGGGGGDDAAILSMLERLTIAKRLDEVQENASGFSIPRFFRKQSDYTIRSIQNQALSECRKRLMQKKIELLMEPDEMRLLWNSLQEYATHFVTAEGTISDRIEDGWIRYDQIRQISESFSIEKQQEYFSPLSFLRFRLDPYGCIRILPFFQYVVLKGKMLEARINLTLSDSVGDGFLRPTDIQSFLADVVSTAPAFTRVSDEFLPYYYTIGARRFQFYLDPMGLGKISIAETMTSPVLTELVEMQLASSADDRDSSSSSSLIGGGGGGGDNSVSGSSDEDGGSANTAGGDSNSIARLNWFHPEFAMRIYGQFVQLDEDHDGLLSLEEMKSFGTGSLTVTFLQHLFLRYQTGRGGLTFNDFIDFVCAFEDKKTRQALRYFWRILDIRGEGVLTPGVIHVFLRDVLQLQETLLRPEDVNNEIFDLVNPSDRSFLTIEDLLRSQAADTVVSMLIDAKAFWAYDNRESLMGQQ